MKYIRFKHEDWRWIWTPWTYRFGHGGWAFLHWKWIARFWRYK